MDATLELTFKDAAEAAMVAQAIGPDDPEHAKVTVQGDTVHVTASASSVGGILRTLDDVLACVRAAAPDA